MSATKQHFLIVSYHFHPSSAVGARRPTALKKFLEEHGAQVSVIRGAASDSEPTPADPSSATTDDIVRLPKKRLSALWRALKPSMRRGKPAAPAADPSAIAARPAPSEGPWSPIAHVREALRAWNGFLQSDKLWLLKFYFRVRTLPANRRYSAVIASGPPDSSYLAGLMAARRFGAPLVLDFRDPWFLHHEFRRSRHPVFRYLGGFEDRYGQTCIRNASLIVAASPGIRDHINRSYEVGETPITVIRNGFDPDSVMHAAAPRGRLRMIYAGTLYYNRNPFPFLDALRDALSRSDVDRDKVDFILVGNCSHWNGLSIDSWVEENDLGDVVEVRDSIPHAELATLIELANVLVNFSQGQPLQIPAKSYEHLASRRDIVCIAETDSDVARLHTEAGYGHVVAPDDTQGMQDALLNLYRKYVVDDDTMADAEFDFSPYSRASQFGKLLPELQKVSKPL